MNSAGLALVYALVAAVLTSFLPIINKRLLAGADVAVVAWGFNALSLPILGGITFLLVPFSQTDSFFWLGIVGSGILNMAATLVSTQALKLGDASLVTPFLTFNPVFTLFISSFTLQELPSSNGVVGVLLVASGGYLFAAEKASTDLIAPIKAMVRQRSILLAILASFVWGLTPIIEKIAIQHSIPENPPLVAFWTTCAMSLLLFPGMLRRHHHPWQQFGQHKQGFLAAAIIAGIAPLFGFTAIALGFVAYVTAIFKLSTVFTVVLAYFILKERGVRQRLLGSGVMVLGAIMLTR